MLSVLATAFCLGGCAAPRGVNYTADGYSLNTYVKVTLYGCGSQRLADEAVKMCSYYEEIFSRTSETSRLYALNENGSLDIETEEDKRLADALKSALQYGEMTDGALDITIEPLSSAWDFGGDASVPDKEQLEAALKLVDYRKVEASNDRILLNGARLDMGAVAKGYIADRIKEYLIGEGVPLFDWKAGGLLQRGTALSDVRRERGAADRPRLGLGTLHDCRYSGIQTRIQQHRLWTSAAMPIPL